MSVVRPIAFQNKIWIVRIMKFGKFGGAVEILNEATSESMAVESLGIEMGRAGAVRAIAPEIHLHARAEFCAASEGGVTTVETCASGSAPAAKLRLTTRARRGHIATKAGFLLCR